MSKLKMPTDLKKLLAVQGANDEAIQLVESYFNSQAEALVEQSRTEQQERPKQQSETPRSKQEMARQARLIK
ncbi:hypothetical protein [Planomicrobium sp. YIM 101495]|uniref:hypothetical protein n=1 Tax=Planomicrobium sp. YIM 101495 TaxID=2665160 RepID=UPI0012B86991|nr:hypothetical protein [Planomicrobium sp. YIM 101495]MTD31842.1 hypothetical protein [Planomicrobium sp. YIM 101495]